MPLVEQLNSLASSLRIASSPVSLEPGQTIDAHLEPDPKRLQISDIVTSTLDITWVIKQVRYQDHLPETSLAPGDLRARILGGLPISGLPTLPGIPGDLGQLRGSLGLPSDLQVPISVTVAWRVTDASGGDLTLGSDFLAPRGLDGTEVTVLLSPLAFELTSAVAPPPPVGRMLHARVTLSAGGEMSAPVDLPPIPLMAPPLGIPKLLALFRDPNFNVANDDAWVVVVVPSTSPIASLTELRSLLDRLGTILGSLRGFTAFAAFATGISELSTAIAAQPYARLHRADGGNSVGDLGDIEFRGWDLWRGYNKAEDHASALILIAAAGDPATGVGGVELNNSEGNEISQGRFTVTTGAEMLAILRSFARPLTVAPAGAMVVENRAPGGRRDTWSITSFDNELSSLRFT